MGRPVTPPRPYTFPTMQRCEPPDWMRDLKDAGYPFHPPWVPPKVIERKRRPPLVPAVRLTPDPAPAGEPAGDAGQPESLTC